MGDAIALSLSAMRLLITGAGGMLGADVAQSARRDGHDVVALAHADLDIVDREGCASAIVGARADVVVNCAAYTDVDGAESDEETATAVNGLGAGQVARAAAAAGAAIVHISSDYVFDGSKAAPYVETDPPAPVSAYGRSKLAGELAVADGNPERHAVVRSSWLFGLGGPNFVETMLRMAAERDEVSVVTDQVGCPTWTGHLGEGIVELCKRFAPGVHHVAGGGSASWYEFAMRIFEATETDCAVRPTTTAEFPRPARRPANSVLASSRAETPSIGPWEQGLEAYLAQRAAVAPPEVEARGNESRR